MIARGYGTAIKIRPPTKKYVEHNEMLDGVLPLGVSPEPANHAGV